MDLPLFQLTQMVIFAAVSVNLNLHSEKICEMNKSENLCMKLREAFVSEITGEH